MHNLFEPAVAAEVTERLGRISADTPPKWGKMNAAQMMAHCQGPFQVFFGEVQMKRGLAAMLFGKIARRQVLGPKPFSRNLPTAREFKVAGERNFQMEKEKLIRFIDRFSTEGYNVIATVHPFFGKLSSQEWALFAYKHLDHHLQQFGA